jgi:hypothetical protein
LTHSQNLISQRDYIENAARILAPYRLAGICPTVQPHDKNLASILFLAI